MKHPKRCLAWIRLAAICVVAIATSQTANAAPPFRAAVEAHLAAVAARDMEALLPTITGGKELPKDGKAQTSTNWLTLTFALENGSWRLVFDQNTAIANDGP